MTRISLRRGTGYQWATANPVLAAGEAGLETDTGHLKFGNGINDWVALPYFMPNHTHDASAITGQLTYEQLPSATVIGNAADLNTYTTDGVFSQGFNTQAAAGFNYPQPLAGLLEVRVGNNIVYQRYSIYNTGREWIRTRYQSVWSAWREAGIEFSPTTITYSNGWAAFNSASYATLRAIQTSDGSVTLSGMPKPGTISEGVAIGVLPAQYRPTKDQYMATVARTSVPSNVACFIVVRANGNVEVFGAPSTTTYLNIGVSYVLAAV